MSAPANDELAPARLHLTEIGGTGSDRPGRRIVFLHGLFGQGKNWTTIAKALSSQAQPDQAQPDQAESDRAESDRAESDQARIVLVDLPNHGRSSWTESVGYREMALSVAAELGSDEPVAVVGHSMGGKVAMALALLKPELVERLVVVDIAPVRYQRLSSFADYVQGMQSITLTPSLTRADADAQLHPYVPDDVVRSFLLQNLRRDPASDTGWRWQMNLELLGAQLTSLGNWPDLGVEPYPGPVLWVAGANSDYITPAYAPAMRASFPRAQLVTVKNAGHWVHSEQPEIFLAILRRFLS